MFEKEFQMDFMTSSILSGVVYDVFNSGVKLTVQALKKPLQGWLIDEEIIAKLVDKISESGISEDMGQAAIQRRIDANDDLSTFLKQIKNGENQSLSMRDVSITLESNEIGTNNTILINSNQIMKK